MVEFPYSGHRWRSWSRTEFFYGDRALALGSTRRTASTRVLKQRILLVCEGAETEPNYFDGLKREEEVRRRYVVKVIGGKGKTPEEVVKRAIDRAAAERKGGDRFDEAWCVLDVEDKQKRASLDRAIRQAELNDISVCFSNPSFEVWFLAHLTRSSRSFLDAGQVESELKKHWRRKFRAGYHKHAEHIYSHVARLTETAITNAKAVRETDHGLHKCTADCNSSTDVYLIVSRLLTKS